MPWRSDDLARRQPFMPLPNDLFYRVLGVNKNSCDKKLMGSVSMALGLSHIECNERWQFFVIGAFLLVNSLVLESNKVIATSGFVSHIGVQHIVWVWALDMSIIMITAAFYSLIVDRTNRVVLMKRLFVLFSLLYLLFYLLFQVETLAWLAYPLLTILNDQQWSLFGLLIWALASDTFSTAQAKRLFPLLATTVIVGSIVGNSTVATMAQLLHGHADRLLLLNALLMVGLALLLLGFQHWGKLDLCVRPATDTGSVTDILREGFAFVQDVPVFRYLALAIIPLGLGYNTVEYYLLYTLSTMDAVTLQMAYGLFKSLTAVSVLLIQALATTRLINHFELRRVFAFLPLVLLICLGGTLVLPAFAIFGVNYLTRITLQGIDEPARQMLKNLVPDERRGRVSAFLNGYLYPIGSILGCMQIGFISQFVQHGLLTATSGQWLYLMISIVCVAFALWAALQIHHHYATSLLNWRLDRRKRRSSIPNLDLL
jgi:ATP:ADP antiporter, AAA family